MSVGSSTVLGAGQPRKRVSIPGKGERCFCFLQHLLAIDCCAYHSSYKWVQG